MANLSIAIEQHDINITQSAATVKAIVKSLKLLTCQNQLLSINQ